MTGPLALDAHGDANAVFVFKTVSTLTTGSGAIVQLINGASPCNVFWKIGSSATLGTGTIFVGNILALTMITVTTGKVVHGRALARNDAVTLDSNTFRDDGCCLSGGTPGIPIVTVVPPPSETTPELNTLLLFGAGALGLGAYARTRFIARRRIHD